MNGACNVAFSTRHSAAIIGALAASALLLTGCSSGDANTEPASDAKEALVTKPTIIKDGTLTVCVGTATPPTAFIEEDGTNIGAEIDLAVALADELGLTTEYAEYAFPGRIPALQSKQCDVIMSSIYIKPEREEIVDFVPYMTTGSSVAVSEANPAKITGFDESLCGTKLLGITGATATLDAEALNEQCIADGKPAIDMTYTDQSTTAFQQVIAGQVDAYTTAADIIGYYEMQSDGEFHQVGEPFGVVELGAATLKDNSDLHDALAKAFDTVIESGQYDEILESWGLSAQSILKTQ